jgi:hypothetical protein
MLEFQAEVPKMFTVKLPPPYYIWLIIPKTEAGAEDVKHLLKEMVKRVGVAPLNEGEWEDVKLIKERLLGGVEVRGAAENLWASL